MILWMAWSTLVSLLLGFIALAAERSVRAAGRSARGVWSLAILGSLTLQAWALLRTAEAPSRIPTASVSETASVTISMLAELQAVAFSLHALLDRYEPVALIAWVCAAAVGVVVLLGGLAHLFFGGGVARNAGMPLVETLSCNFTGMVHAHQSRRMGFFLGRQFSVQNIHCRVGSRLAGARRRDGAQAGINSGQKAIQWT